MGSRLQERQVWYQFIQPLVTPSLTSIAELKAVVALEEVMYPMGEATVRLTKRLARRDMIMMLMEGMLTVDETRNKASVSLYLVKAKDC